MNILTTLCRNLKTFPYVHSYSVVLLVLSNFYTSMFVLTHENTHTYTHAHTARTACLNPRLFSGWASLDLVSFCHRHPFNDYPGLQLTDPQASDNLLGQLCLKSDPLLFLLFSLTHSSSKKWLTSGLEQEVYQVNLQHIHI